jgi:hypothetical protein
MLKAPVRPAYGKILPLGTVEERFCNFLFCTSPIDCRIADVQLWSNISLKVRTAGKNFDCGYADLQLGGYISSTSADLNLQIAEKKLRLRISLVEQHCLKNLRLCSCGSLLQAVIADIK